ncbi:Endonuclease domain-containing 1 protein [Oryzias melastigma]|uniref:Endonuclease domain-containing 1 protein n=1 Tax=Oryzias melastigma TaxID=30732 RepID=A0A834CAS6_ORYME|nr:Endonuclease domain-containing 1 protein [Oryzias melastigma]
MLLFLLLVFLPAVPIETEVVGTLADCLGFFVKETPPEIPDILVGGNILNQTRYKIICQTFEDIRRFLTLYDTDNKIPVFSAYRFTGAPSKSKRPGGNIWKIEPQLEDDINMRSLRQSDTLRNQATDSDYSNDQGYHKGHLYPNSHAPDMDAKRSTFTLTNAVPQVGSFNCGNWAQMEKRTKCFMEKNCINASGKIEAFVVTGAEPGNETLNNTMNIPSRMWSAFCCHNSREGVWYSKAYWGPNVFKGIVKESSHQEMKATFGIEIFPVMFSFLNNVDSSRTHPCEKENPFQSEITTDTAPPSTTDHSSPAEKTTFPPNSTPASPMTPKTTTTLAAATKTTQPTSITSRYTSVINQEDCEDDEETNS